MSSQKRHVRTSRKGKRFFAGKKKSSADWDREHKRIWEYAKGCRRF